MSAPDRFEYSPWRHGGWYVHNVRYPNGAIGCVSRNYADHKWRIVCDRRPFEDRPTFKNRDDAARAEWMLTQSAKLAPFTVIYTEPSEGLELWQFFECSADDGDHAEEQCLNAYPTCAVLWVNQGHGPQSQTME